MKVRLLIWMWVVQNVFAAGTGLHAQVPEYGFDVLLTNFVLEGSSRVPFNTLQAVYGDTDQVVAVIQAPIHSGLLDPANQTLYISIHDLEGNQRYLKRVNIPPPYASLDLRFRFCNNLIRLDNGNYMVAGWTMDTLAFDGGRVINRQFYYIFDRAGDSVRMEVLTDESDLRPMDMAKDPNGNAISLVHERAFDPEEPFDSSGLANVHIGIMLVKMDPRGELLWQRTVPGTSHFRDSHKDLLGISVSPDGLHYVIAYGDRTRPTILITDSSGEVVRQIYVAHRRNSTDSLRAIDSFYYAAFHYDDIRCTVGKDGYIYYAMTEFAPEFASDAGSEWYYSKELHYGKMTIDGDTVWTKSFSLGKATYWRSERMSIAQADNGDIIILSHLFDYGAALKARQKGILLRIESEEGAVKWYKDIRKFDAREYHFVKALSLFKDKIVIGAGIEFDTVASGMDGVDSYRLSLNGVIGTSWILMLDSLGRRCANDTEYGEIVPPECDNPFPRLLIDPLISAKDFDGVVLYPNPANGQLTIYVKGIGKEYEEADVTIADIQGRIIYQFRMEREKENADLSLCTPGVYLVRVTAGGQVIYSGKVTKI